MTQEEGQTSGGGDLKGVSVPDDQLAKTQAGPSTAVVLTLSEEQMALPLVGLGPPNMDLYRDEMFIEESMPLCPFCRNQLGCVAIGVLQTIWSLLQFISLLVNPLAFPVPFLHVQRTTNLKGAVYANGIVTVLALLLGPYFVYGAMKLHHRALHSYVLGSPVVGGLVLFLGYGVLFIDVYSRGGTKDHLRGEVIGILVVGMCAEILGRVYAIMSGVRLWKCIPHHGPFWMCCPGAIEKDEE